MKPSCLEILRYAIPMRQKIEHAGAARDTSEGLLVRLQLSDGTVGWGEAIPRTYVTGETIESAAEAIEARYANCLTGDDPLSTKPVAGPDGEVQFTSAWCACELAYLDAVCKSEGERVTDFLGRRLALEPVPMLRRISGVIPKAEPLRAAKWLRRMRLVALRDFKVKVGYPDDLKTLAVCGKILSYCMRRGKCTLRVDANGGWTLSEAVSKIGELKRCGVAAIEQPLAKGREKEMADLQKIADIPLMPDESLVTLDDAELALAEGWAQMFNIRISKNGGLVAALALADLARKRGIGFQLGCMVGETGILSAAGRVFLELTGEDVRWAEGSYGRFLLTSDIVRERVTIGYAGRVRPLLGPGLGVTVDESKVERYAITMARLDF